MSEETHESVPPKSGRKRKKTAGEPPRQAPSLFAIVTLVAGVIAVLLILWRIGKAWRIEYGGGPREGQAIPTTGAWGPPGGSGRPPPAPSSQ